jgi:hypothetical protein
MDKMKWTNPKLVEIDEEDMQELMLAIAYEEAWSEVGGFDQFIRDTAAKNGCVVRVIELLPEVAEVSG